MLLVSGLRLFAGNVVAGARVLCRLGNDVGVAELCNAAGEISLHALALANLASNRRGDGIIGRFAQVLHALTNMLLAHQVQHRRLLHLDRKGLGQRGIEDRFSGLVLKVRQNDGIF